MVGPLLGSRLEASPRARVVLDGVIAILVGALCVGALLPHAVEHMGPFAVVIALAVLGLSELARRIRPRESVIWDAVAFGLLLIHAGIDGAALAAVEHQHEAGLALGLAVALHRLPVGLLVYRASHRDLPGRRGVLLGWGTVALLALATALGFGSGLGVDGQSAPWIVGALEALVAGMLLHVVVEQVPVWARALRAGESG